MDRHIREIHLNNSLNCTICDKTYMRKGDLKRPMMKEHPAPDTIPITATNVDNCEIPDSFFDLLQDFEHQELQPTTVSQPSKNKATQIAGKKVIPCETKHTSSNTESKKIQDKATNTEPLIILAPKDIQDLVNGFKLISFDIPEVFIQTTNSHITPRPKFEPKYVPTPISDKPRTEIESNISQIIKESMEKTKSSTITKKFKILRFRKR